MDKEKWVIKGSAQELEELKNIKDNLRYTNEVLEAVYDSLVFKYEEDFEEMAIRIDSCIKHEYMFDRKSGDVVIRPSVCVRFKNGDVHCSLENCVCNPRNYMYCTLKQHRDALQAEYDSLTKGKIIQKTK